MAGTTRENNRGLTASSGAPIEREVGHLYTTQRFRLLARERIWCARSVPRGCKALTLLQTQEKNMTLEEDWDYVHSIENVELCRVLHDMNYRIGLLEGETEPEPKDTLEPLPEAYWAGRHADLANAITAACAMWRQDMEVWNDLADRVEVPDSVEQALLRQRARQRSRVVERLVELLEADLKEDRQAKVDMSASVDRLVKARGH